MGTNNNISYPYYFHNYNNGIDGRRYSSPNIFSPPTNSNYSAMNPILENRETTHFSTSPDYYKSNLLSQEILPQMQNDSNVTFNNNSINQTPKRYSIYGVEIAHNVPEETMKARLNKVLGLELPAVKAIFKKIKEEENTIQKQKLYFTHAALSKDKDSVLIIAKPDNDDRSNYLIWYGPKKDPKPFHMDLDKQNVKKRSSINLNDGRECFRAYGNGKLYELKVASEGTEPTEMTVVTGAKPNKKPEIVFEKDYDLRQEDCLKMELTTKLPKKSPSGFKFSFFSNNNKNQAQKLKRFPTS